MIRFVPPDEFAEFGVTTNFSFLRGASDPEELVAQAMVLKLAAIGIADRNSVAGIVRAHLFLRYNKAEVGPLRVVSGARLVFCDGTPDILAYPRDRAAYGRLCRLLTQGNIRAQKGTCRLMIEDLLEWQNGLQLIVLPASTFEQDSEAKAARRSYVDFDEVDDGTIRDAGTDDPPLPRLTKPLRVAHENSALERLVASCPDRLWLGASMTYGKSMRADLAKRRKQAERFGLPLLATNDVVMHDPARRELLDAVTCIRLGTTLDAAGRKLAANAERHLKPAAEMRRLFAEAPEAVPETLRFLDGLAFSLDELRGDYPEELREGYATPQEALTAFAAEGAAAHYPRDRYPEGVPESITKAIAHELALVAEMQYAPYFLTVHDIVRYARSRGILCQGRGSAANSTLCYCLGITAVDPEKNSLLFERFISTDRQEPPDIDVDFEHERREEVMQYIYERYGRARAALTASVVTYRARSAIREVGKVFGFSDDAIGALSGTIWGHGEGENVNEAETRRAGLEPSEPGLAKALSLARELSGFPRHLSQHTGGFVISRTRLDEVVPIANAAMDGRTTVEWDKDDLDALGILKIDVLALGMLSCLRGCFDLLARHYDRTETLATVPQEEKAIYAMIQKADTLGVFQIESRAQMSMLPRLKPETFYDLVIEVAIVRPGPIQGDMVHPYLRRRTGKETVTYPKPELEAVLGKTLGVPLFQEQAMKIAIVAAGFSPSQADQLRRAMATFKRVGTISTFFDKMVQGMVANGYEAEFATRCFKQIEGFGTYGFPESHAASFAILVYVSCWFKCRYPDVFACALLNAQPMGFYAPAQIVRDALEHGVPIADIDVNFSDWDCTLFEPDGERPAIHSRHAERAGDILGNRALRLGFRQVKGLRKADMERLVALRGIGYDSVRDVWLRTDLAPSVLEVLAEADTFRSIGLDRREALWIVRGLNRAGDKDDLPLLKTLRFVATEPEAKLPPMPLGQHVVDDYRHLSLSLKAHPVAFVRAELAARGMLRADALADQAAGTRVTVAGLVLVRQRPGSAKGTIFLTLEDEAGIANIIVWPKIFERVRPIVVGARFIAITGRLQRDGDVMHVVTEKAEDLTRLLGRLSSLGPQVSALARADEIRRPLLKPRSKRRAPLGELPLFDGHSHLSVTDVAVADGAVSVADMTPALRQVLPKGRNFQ